MKLPSPLIPLASAFALMVFSTSAADTAPAVSASDLAAKLSALQQDGASYVRLKMEVTQFQIKKKFAMQLQIKQRRTASATEVVYQVLWPKERVGESILLRKLGNQAPTGTLFLPPNTMRTITAAQMSSAFLDSDLSYADLVENFFAWEHQAIVGKEVVDNANCQILESKPGKGQHSIYASVRTWVDTRKLVPMRVEKYSASGELARRIETKKVVTNDIHNYVPANLTIERDTLTELDGSKIKHDVKFTDREFTPEGLKEITPPRSSP